MMEPLGHPRLPERERVMARVTVQEGDVEARFDVAIGLRLQRAQAMVEYALILVLVAIVVIAVLIALGTGITNTFQTIVNHLK